MADLEALGRRMETLKAARANWDTLWQEIAERVLPSMADFTSRQADGSKRTERMFDPTAALAATKAVSAISAFIWPSNQRYQRLTTDDPALNKSARVKAYLDDVTDTLFRARYSPRASFEAQMAETGLQHFVFGTGLVYVDEDIKRAALSYKAVHLGQCYIDESPDGRIDTIYRCWMWPLRKIAKRWPGKLPQKLADRLATHPDEQVHVAHVVMPREDYEPSKLGHRSMPWASVYWLPDHKAELQDGGFHSWPFGVMRYMTSPGEVYGRSPAWLALSSIKTLNEQKRTILKAGQKLVDPPLLAHDDGIMAAFSQVPGAINFGALDPQGNQLVKPLITGANVGIGLDMMDREREIISGAFMMDVFRVLIENPNMTATQTLELLNERAIHMAQVGGRIESEALGPMTEREIDLLARAGQLPEMPPELIEAEGEYRIEYTSPMRKAARSSEAIAIARTLEQITPMAQVDASILDVFDLHAAAREVAEIQGVPAKILRDAKAMAALKDQRAQQDEAAQLLQAAPVVSQTAANLAKLQAAGGQLPGF